MDIGHVGDLMSEAQALFASAFHPLPDNRCTAVQIVLEPAGDGGVARLTMSVLESLRKVCYQNPSYLDRFYSVLPGRPKGAKRLVVALPTEIEELLDEQDRERLENYPPIFPLPSPLSSPKSPQPF